MAVGMSNAWAGIFTVVTNSARLEGSMPRRSGARVRDQVVPADALAHPDSSNLHGRNMELQRSMIPTGPYFHVKEVAETLAISPERVRQLFRQGPGVINIASNPKGRRSLRISASAIEAMRRKLQAA
jgi:hypothetical protein